MVSVLNGSFPFSKGEVTFTVALRNFAGEIQSFQKERVPSGVLHEDKKVQISVMFLLVT